MSDAVRIAVRLTPKASRNEVLGWATGPDGGKVLKVSVTAVPEKVKANKALIALLSKNWGIPKSAIDIARGETDRNKILEIKGFSGLFESETLF